MSSVPLTAMLMTLHGQGQLILFSFFLLSDGKVSVKLAGRTSSLYYIHVSVRVY